MNKETSRKKELISKYVDLLAIIAFIFMFCLVDVLKIVLYCLFNLLFIDYLLIKMEKLNE